jgi:5-methyltetrahydropteroyltriglutamate--homocysteine methyltransferase
VATNSHKGPYRADHVGSLIRPDRLLEARAKRKTGEITQDALKQLEDECIREVISLQESAGMKVVTDGEFRRQTWHVDFLTGFDNVSEAPGKLDVYFKQADGTLTSSKPNGMYVSGKLKRSKSIQGSDFEFIKKETKVTPKVCIPSPSLMHFRGGREAIDAKAYPNMADFWSDLARVYNEEIQDLVKRGLKYLQIDDTNLAYLCDDNFRAAVKALGEDPDKLPATYVKLINDCIKGLPSDVTTAIHLCRGNASTGGVAKGGYEPVAEALLGGLEVDGFFLEYDDERSGNFQPLRFVPKGKTVVLGLMTTKNPRLESTDELKRRIDEATKIVSLDQLALSPQCGFSSGAGKRPLTIDDEKKKLARIVETADAVWGHA